jgi:hypothetical protein
MCVSGGFGGFHYSQLRRVANVTSSPLSHYRSTRLPIQNRELVENQPFLLSGPTVHYSQMTTTTLILSDVTETPGKRG